MSQYCIINRLETEVTDLEDSLSTIQNAISSLSDLACEAESIADDYIEEQREEAKNEGYNEAAAEVAEWIRDNLPGIITRMLQLEFAPDNQFDDVLTATVTSEHAFHGLLTNLVNDIAEDVQYEVER